MHGSDANRQRRRAAPALTGDPRTDGALLALARLLAEIAAGVPEPQPAAGAASEPGAPATVGGAGGRMGETEA